jgi:hypothetical protein
VQQHLSSILQYSDQERGPYKTCVVQQYDSLQTGLYLQVKETFVSFCVHQHPCLKFELCHLERETRAASCVQQHQFLKF